MSRWCARALRLAEALEILAKAKIPAGPVLSRSRRSTIPTSRPMGFFQPTEFPGAPRPAPIAKVPVWLSETPGPIRRRAADARASTPTRSWASSATTRQRLRRCGRRA